MLTCPVPGCCQPRSVGALLCPGCAATVPPWLMRAADKALAEYQKAPTTLGQLQRCNQLVIEAAQVAVVANADPTLPVGRSCGQCVHWRRCSALIQDMKPESTVCDFAPSRFRAAPPAPALAAG